MINAWRLGKYRLINGETYSVTFSPDGSLIAAGKGECAALDGPRKENNSLAISNNSHFIATGELKAHLSYSDFKIKIWNAKTGQFCSQLDGHTD